MTEYPSTFGSGTVIWFTGLSGSGKSTLAHALHQRLATDAIRSVILDGDDLRQELCADLGFSDTDRRTQMTRTSALARLLVRQGLVVLVSLISPIAELRSSIRSSHQPRFLEVYCAAPIAVCQKRDPKGLYRKAQRGEIALMTGMASAYEPPLTPDLHLNTDTQTLDESLELIYRCFQEHWQSLKT